MVDTKTSDLDPATPATACEFACVEVAGTGPLKRQMTAVGASMVEAASAAAERVILNVDKRTTKGDADATIAATDKVVVTTVAFTAARTWTLPAANSVNAGQEIIVADEAGAVTSTNTLIVARAGSDTINGGTTETLTAAYAMRRFISDGTSKWTFDAGIVRLTATQTLTNKRVTKRVQSVSDAATITPNADNDDCVDITAIAQAFTIANPSGTPTNFQQLIIRVKDNGTARAITWGSNYVAGGASLPTTTVLSKTLTVGLIYNTANALNKFQCVSVSQEV